MTCDADKPERCSTCGPKLRELQNILDMVTEPLPYPVLISRPARKGTPVLPATYDPIPVQSVSIQLQEEDKCDL